MVAGDFVRAHGMLAPALATELGPADLRDAFRGMFEGYAAGEPLSIHCDPDVIEPGVDEGWAYVGILGDDFVEGIAVVVIEVGGELRINEIDWGRP